MHIKQMQVINISPVRVQTLNRAPFETGVSNTADKSSLEWRGSIMPAPVLLFASRTKKRPRESYLILPRPTTKVRRVSGIAEICCNNDGCLVTGTVTPAHVCTVVLSSSQCRNSHCQLQNASLSARLLALVSTCMQLIATASTAIQLSQTACDNQHHKQLRPRG
jgi:hypothetical protein